MTNCTAPRRWPMGERVVNANGRKAAIRATAGNIFARQESRKTGVACTSTFSTGQDVAEPN